MKLEGMKLEIGKTYLTSHENDPYEVTIVAEYEGVMAGRYRVGERTWFSSWGKDGKELEFEEEWNLREMPEEPKKIEKIDLTGNHMNPWELAETLNKVIDKLNELTKQS